MSEIEKKYPVILDRIADMQLKHSLETGAMDAVVYEGEAVDSWQFEDKEIGDTLIISEAPSHLQYFARAIISLHSEAEDLILITENGRLSQPDLTFVIDLDGVPYVKLNEEGEYEAVEPDCVAELLDERMYYMTAYFDHRVLPPATPEGLDNVFETPTAGTYTLASAAVNQSEMAFSHSVAHLQGKVSFRGNDDETFDYGLQVEPEDNLFDRVGFNRIFNVIMASDDSSAVYVQPLGRTHVEQVIGECFEYSIGRDGVAIRYPVETEEGEIVERLGFPLDGDQILIDYFKRASLYDPNSSDS